MVVLAALTIFFLNKTVVGRWIYAIGGNEEGARISGVRVNRVKRLVYSLSGLMAAISGIAMAARLGVGQSTAGQSYEMDAIAATVIGGASLSGGSGSIVGAIIGAAIMGVLRNGLVLFSPLHLFHLRNESNNGVHAWRLQKWLPTALAASPNCSTTISDIVVQCQRAIVMCPIRSLSFQIAFSS